MINKIIIIIIIIIQYYFIILLFVCPRILSYLSKILRHLNKAHSSIQVARIISTPSGWDASLSMDDPSSI